jgi:hypothetical protein
VAISPALLLIPAALLFMGARKKGGPSGLTPEQQRAWDEYRGGWGSRDGDVNLGTEDGFPLSDRMLLTDDCAGPAAKAVKWRYDVRITNYYWYLRREMEWDNPVAIAAEILHYDSPHCEWPPPPEAPEWQHILWDGTYTAVQTYFSLEQTGELWDYAVDPYEVVSKVKPLVVWAS